MTTITKTTRADQIAAVIESVAKYHDLDPVKVYKSFSSSHKPMRKARVMIWFHLRKCGMSIDSIARLFKLGYDSVQRAIQQGKVSFSEEDLTLIATLPKIKTSLNIMTNANTVQIKP